MAMDASEREKTHFRVKEGDEVKLLTRELLNLSFDDRNAIQEEIHGVRSMAISENSDLIVRSLHEFQQELDRRFPPGENEPQQHAYSIILSRRRQENETNAKTTTTTKSRHHFALDDHNFRLRFLRAELFDVNKAVQRFLNYLETTREYWGNIALERLVTLKDILEDKQDREFLKAGFIQILPFRDQSGRRVLTVMGEVVGERINYRSRAKCIMYLLDVISRDCVETQRCGIVTVLASHALGSKSYSDFRTAELENMKRTMSSNPTRLAVLHFCIPETLSSRLLLTLLFLHGMTALGERRRVRIVMGTELECWYALRSYGIPTHLFPLTETGNIKLTYFYQWKKTRTLVEERYVERQTQKFSTTASNETNNSEETELEIVNGIVTNNYYGENCIFANDDERGIVECPGVKDVVFRQGTPSSDNPGNVAFRDLILTHLEEKNRKMRQQVSAKCDDYDWNFEDQRYSYWLVEEIVNKRGGRFLEWDKKLSSWVHIGYDSISQRTKIRQKVLVAIHNYEKTRLRSWPFGRNGRRNAVVTGAHTITETSAMPSMDVSTLSKQRNA